MKALLIKAIVIVALALAVGGLIIVNSVTLGIGF